MEMVSHKIINLMVKKEAIKDLVINPTLNWQERISLYTQVRVINEQILLLQTREGKTTHT